MSDQMNTNNFTEPRWQRKKEDRPAEILKAALDLFVEKGYASTRVDQVAKAAGVTPGTVYLYYKGKESLLKAVVHESIVPLISFANNLLDDYQGSAHDLFQTLVYGWWEQFGAADFGGVPKLIAAEAVNFPELANFYMEEVMKPGRLIFKRVLEYGQKSGEFAVSNMKATIRLAMAPLQYASIHTFSLAEFEKDNVNIKTYLKVFIDIFLRGISATK